MPDCRRVVVPLCGLTIHFSLFVFFFITHFLFCCLSRSFRHCMCAFCFCSTLLHVRCPVVVVFVWLRVYFRCCNSAYRTQVVVCVYLYLSFVYLLTVAVLSLNLRTHSHSRILITFFLPFDFRWNTRRKRVLVYKLWSDRWDRIYLVSFCFVVQLNGSSLFFFCNPISFISRLFVFLLVWWSN